MKKMKRVASSEGNRQAAIKVQHDMVNSLESAFQRSRNNISEDMSMEERDNFQQTMENGKIRLNKVIKTMFNNAVEVYIVEEIYRIQMRPLNSDPTLQVYVKWLGYDNPSDNTWEPVYEMEANEALGRFYERNSSVVMDVNAGYMADSRFAGMLRL